MSSKKAFILYSNSFSNLGEPIDISIDWSKNTSVQASPSPCVSPTGEHISLPHISMPYSIGENNMSRSSHQSASGLGILVLNYSNNQLTNLSLQNRLFQVLLIFKNDKSRNIDIANIAYSLKRVATYINQHPVTNKVSGDFVDVIKTIWSLVNTIYKTK